jgi:sulfur-oxidizing protein SoxZ
MAAKVKIRGKIKEGVAEVKTLMPHPMETGTRRDSEGGLIGAHYIQTVTCFKNDNRVMQAHWGPAVSKNPFFAFKVKNCSPGDTIKVSWLDNLGEKSSGELVLK